VIIQNLVDFRKTKEKASQERPSRWKKCRKSNVSPKSCFTLFTRCAILKQAMFYGHFS